LNQKLRILIVEGNALEAIFIKESFESANLINTIDVLRNGNEVKGYLQEIKDLPDLVLIDLRIPGKSGRDILTSIRESEKYKHLPVVVLATLFNEEDIISAFENHVISYILKPFTKEKVRDIVEALQSHEQNEDIFSIVSN